MNAVFWWIGVAWCCAFVLLLLLAVIGSAMGAHTMERHRESCRRAARANLHIVPR
jgi:membrane protein required for beta-lactamase induction